MVGGQDAALSACRRQRTARCSGGTSESSASRLRACGWWTGRPTRRALRRSLERRRWSTPERAANSWSAPSRAKIIACSRKGKTPADKIGKIWEAHTGPLYALRRNPTLPKFYISIGDWCVKLWNEEITSPIITSKCFKSYVTDAAWSPTRPGVFVATKLDGTLDVWDIFYKQSDPTLSLQVDADALKCVRVQEAGSLLATGTADGSVYMLELSENLSTIQNNEKVVVLNMLERESKREKNLEARAKELKAKAKRMADASKAPEQETTPWEEVVKGIEEQFWEAVGGKEDDQPE